MKIDERFKELYNDANKLYTDMLRTGVNPFEALFKNQQELQRKFYTLNKGFKNPDAISTLGEKYDFIRDNKTALDDEFREVVDALAGSQGTSKERSALWKRWKSACEQMRAKSYKDLTPDEIANIKEEFSDMFIFMMNMAIALEISAKDLFIFTYVKSKENQKRLEENY